MKEFKGNSFYYKTGLYNKLMFPLVQLKIIFNSLYKSIGQIIWAELIKGKKIDNEITSLILFVIFCILSLIIYYLQNYKDFIFISFIIIWYLDYFFAQNQYFNLKKSVHIKLKQSENSSHIQYSIKFPNHKNVNHKLNSEQIKQIEIIVTEAKGGAFEENMGLIWQCFLMLYNDKSFLINEGKNPNEILNQAEKFNENFKLNLPIIFKSSQGNNKYGEFSLNEDMWQDCNTIRTQINERKYHIYSKWSFGNSWNFLKQVFNESGFLLFVIIMSDFMMKFGSWVNFFIGNYLGWKIPVLNIYSMGEWFSPKLDLIDIIEIAIGIVIMIIQGWKISRQKHFYLDKYFLKYFIDNKKITQFSTPKIKTILLFKKPQLSLFILDDEQWLKITELQEKRQFKTILLKLEEGLNKFRVSS